MDDERGRTEEFFASMGVDIRMGDPVPPPPPTPPAPPSPPSPKDPEPIGRRA